MIGLENRNGTLGSDDAMYMWIYIVGPLVGSLFASLFYMLHNYIDRHVYDQVKPMQFLGLMKTNSSFLEAQGLGNQNQLDQNLLNNQQQQQQNEAPISLADRSRVWNQLHNTHDFSQIDLQKSYGKVNVINPTLSSEQPMI
jgi:hypothetical protein